MKNFQSTFIFLAILIVLLAAFFLSNNILAYKDKAIYKLAPQSIVQIAIESEQGRCSFIKNGDNWKMIEPKEYKINEELVNMMARKLENLEALRILQNNSGDLSQYGLDRPSMTIWFRHSEGQESKLLIGHNTASNYQYYVMDSDSEAVCTITANDLEVFKEGKAFEFRDRCILTQGLGRVKRFGIESGENKEIELIEYEAGKWLLVEPCKVEVKNDYVNEILSAVAKLEIKEFIEDDPEDLDKYGLENPMYTLFLEDEKGSIRNFYFCPAENDKKELYIKTDSEKGVFKISSDAFNPGLIVIEDLINIAPLSIGVGHISKITINDYGIISEFKRDFANPDDDIFTLNGHHISSEDFMALYVNIMALSAEGYDETGMRFQTELSITFDLINSPESIKLDLSKRDEKSYFIALNGESLPFYIKGKKIDLVRKWMNRILEAR